MTLDPRGSLWSRWDLHVHTPASIVHRYPGTEAEAWEKFLSDIEGLPTAYRVLGINDYLFLDGYERVLKERQNGRLTNIDLVLPVVELRLNVFGGTESRLSKVNYHVVFSDELEAQVIREQFLGALSSKFELVPRLRSRAASAWSGVLTRGALEDLGKAIIESVPDDERKRYGPPLQEGFNNLTLPIEAVEEALKSSFLKGHFVTGVGKTEWADIKWKGGAIADKKHVINSVDCVFTAAESPSAYKRAQSALRDAEVNYRLLDCSDAHQLSGTEHKDRIGNCFTWIKADPTFGGLLQAIEEFEQRVFVGDEPEQLRRVKEHPSKYIDRVKISKVAGSTLSDEWFSIDLPFNSGLVAIIGNKGSGKSALAEVIGLAGGSLHEEHFSFLTDSKFRDSRRRLADHFAGEVMWCDGTPQVTGLSDHMEPGRETRVQHLPQRYLESLCNEVPSGDKTRFDEELERIIFAHLSLDQRLETQSLSELIEVATGSIDTEVEERRGALAGIDSEVATLEDDQRPEVILARRTAYRALRKEWLSLRDNPPEEVPEPDQADPALAAVREHIRELGIASQHLGEFLDGHETRLAEVRRDLADLASFRTNLESLQREHTALRDANQGLLERLGVPETVSSFTIDSQALDAARTALAAEETALVDLLGSAQSAGRGLREVMDWIGNESDSERAKLSAPEEAREAYVKRRAAWETEVADLLGPSESEDLCTVLGARRSHFSLRAVPARLDALRAERRMLTGEIHRLLLKKASESSAFYEPLQTYMDSQGLPKEYQIAVGTSLVDTSLADVLLGELLNRQVAGSFSGVADSEQRLSDLLNGTDFDDEESVLEFLGNVDEHLRVDMRKQPPTSTVPSAQVRKGKTVEDLYNWVFGLSYLSPRYGLLFGGKPIYQLSPGEKGTLLLVFFLLAELDTRPLIIDQPEDNLDNNTVYRALVKCFQKAKERRQVVIVTHNPNLAVVCDADQIIVASMDKSGSNRVTYQPGAIERPATVSAVVDILEGTQPAFQNRSVKYTMHLLRHAAR